MSRTTLFADQVDEWVLLAIEGGAVTFDDIVRNLRGVFPVEVANSVRRVCAQHRGYNSLLPRETAAQTLNSSESSQELDWLPIPHPLDFDWRFNDSGTQCLLDVALNGDVYPAAVGILGAPSVVPSLLKRAPGCNVTLYDANPLTTCAVRAHFPEVDSRTLDLVFDSPVEPDCFDVLLADPPWYREQMMAFLWSASRLCRLGGTILMSFPPRGTRPTIDSEREDLLEYSREIGLSTKAWHEGALRYTSPYFEQNAIQAAKLGPVAVDWRAGDLLVFDRRVQNPTERRAEPRIDQWIELGFQDVRLKVRKKKHETADPRLRSLVKGDVLDSVSQRDPRARAVDVWTMGNRVFSCGSTSRFLQIASRFMAKRTESLDSSGEESDVLEVYRQLALLIRAESSRA